MSASAVFNITSGLGGVASERSLTQNSEQIMAYVRGAHDREFRKEAPALDVTNTRRFDL